MVTNDQRVYEKIRLLRDHGQEKKYYHSCVGWNARMDGIQGAVLRVKLKGLDRGNAARRAHAGLYREQLAGRAEVITPHAADYGSHVYHVYAIRVKGRDQLLQALADQGISCGIHYPIPIHLQSAYQSLGLGCGSFPVAERCAQEFLSLPMFPELTPDQVQVVTSELKAHLSTARSSHVNAFGG